MTLASGAVTWPDRISTNSYLEIDVFVCVCAHLVAEAELVLADLVGGKDKVTLALVLAIGDDFTAGSCDFVVDIERPSGLHLSEAVSASCTGSSQMAARTAK